MICTLDICHVNFLSHLPAIRPTLTELPDNQLLFSSLNLADNLVLARQGLKPTISQHHIQAQHINTSLLAIASLKVLLASKNVGNDR
jgi:hypothetical protein